MPEAAGDLCADVLHGGQCFMKRWRRRRGTAADLPARTLAASSLRGVNGAATRVDLVQVGVPERLYEALVNGWPVRYWQPWRAYLERR
jgi:hypothetical protein